MNNVATTVASAAQGTRRRSLILMAALLLALNALAWGMFFLNVLPNDYQLGGSGVFGAGIAVTAYLLGVRHAFDADHIAAIDNTTRTLVARNAAHSTTGMWFALGHSTVVVGAVALLAAGADTLAGQLADDGSVLKQFAGVWGPAVSGTFLILIGAINLGALVGIVQVTRRMRAGAWNEADLERQLAQRGFMARLLWPLARRVDAPWKMYPLGLLFGLGLDTATTIGLFVVAGGAVVALPWQAVMVLPLLFTAGMVLFDGLNGALMGGVYRWAYDKPSRKVGYNLVVTSVSVVIAFLVGAVVLTGLLTDLLGLGSGPVAWLGSIDLETFGFMVAGTMLGAWLLAILMWRVALGKKAGASRAA